jgi:NDP-sugar pyrophosphorylase family protein
VTRRTYRSAIVLAGVHEWGRSHFDRLRPRPLLPVAQTPLICYALDWLARSEVDRVTVCANSDTPAVRAALIQAAPSSLRLDYVSDTTPRGPAGCVRDAARPEDDTIIVVAGTTVPSIELESVLETHEVCNAALTVVVHQERFAQTREWGPLVSAGIYVLDRRALRLIPERGFQDIKEGLIPALHRAGERVVTHLALGASPQIVNAATYLSVNHWVIARLSDEGQAPNPAYATARVADDARILGPVLLAPSATVASGATIIGPAAIGADCRVEAGAVISRSVVWTRCVVGDGAVVDNCILADDARVGPRERLFTALVTPRRRHRSPRA